MYLQQECIRAVSHHLKQPHVKMWRKSQSAGVCSAPDGREGSKFARNTGNPAENKHVLLSHDPGRVCRRDVASALMAAVVQRREEPLE